jgi:hypothetical protein
MVKFILRIEEHEEYGGLGIVFNTGRDYFQPALDGDILAHDILEHPVTPHSNGYIDELMAFGGIIAGRITTGWMTRYGRRATTNWIVDDVRSLADAALNAEDNVCPEICTSYLQDSDLMDVIKTNVHKGLLDAVNEYEDEDYTRIPAEYDYDLESIVGWICRGYQLYRKRFGNNVYDVSNHLFDKISLVCNDWLKVAEEGDFAELIINFSSLNAELIREEV